MANYLVIASDLPALEGRPMKARLVFAKSSTVTRPYIGLLLRVGMRTLTDEDVKLIRGRAGCVQLEL